jgi:hypothetical protein
MASGLSDKISIVNLQLDCQMLEPQSGVSPYLTFRLDILNLAENLTRELYLPIEGLLKTKEPSGRQTFISRAIDVTTANQPLTDIRLPFNTPRIFFLYSPLSWEAVTEIIARFESEEYLEFVLDLKGSFLDAVRTASQRMFGFTPTFEFLLGRKTWERWVSGWATISLALDMPENTPREVVEDFVESLKCLKVGALKAAVAMARRCIELAADSRRAKGSNLVEKLKDLRDEGNLTEADHSLASGVRYFGNYGVHPQDDLLKTITRGDAEISINVTKYVVSRLFAETKTTA